MHPLEQKSSLEWLEMWTHTRQPRAGIARFADKTAA
jgi:hypothetical protein